MSNVLRNQETNIKSLDVYHNAERRKTPCHSLLYVLEKIGSLFNGSSSSLETPTSFYSISSTSSKYRSLPTQVERFSQGDLLARRVARSRLSHLFSFGSLLASRNFSSNLIGCMDETIPSSGSYRDFAASTQVEKFSQEDLLTRRVARSGSSHFSSFGSSSNNFGIVSKQDRQLCSTYKIDGEYIYVHDGVNTLDDPVIQELLPDVLAQEEAAKEK